MNAQEVGSEQAGVGTGDGVVAHPGERFPKDLGPIVTLAAVQRYIDAERQRNRRVLGLAGVAFACLALLVLVLVMSIGIFVLGNTRKATRMVEAVQAQSVAGATELVDMSARVNEVVEGQKKLAETITQERAERAQERQTVKGDMDRVGEWVREGDTREKRALAALEARLEAMEKAGAEKNSALEALRAQYQAVASSLSPRAETAPAGVPDAPSAAPVPKPAMTSVPTSAPEVVPVVATPVPEPVVAPDRADVEAATAKAEPSDVPADEALVSAPDRASAPGTVRGVAFPNGDRFEGGFKNGLLDGWGVYHFRNGDVYEGSFRNDMKEGRGRMTFHNGDQYVGEFRYDQMTGTGTMTYANGNVYTGDFKAGRRHGTGSLRFANGDLYKGEFVRGVRQGKGLYVFRGGARYIGEFKNDRREGQGRYVYASGEEYVGGFKEGRKEGVGVCIYADGRRLKGFWEDDKFARPIDG